MLFTSSKPLVFDGAMGTMLQRRGLKTGTLPEALNLTEPELITSIHKEYINAGAQVVTTNTFGANSLKLGSDLSVESVVIAAVNAAKKACEGTSCRVALDMGPTGALLEPVGNLSFDRAYELYAEQVRAGVKAGADMIIIETMSDLLECKAAVLAAKENSSLPVLLSLSFGEDGRTFMGTDAETAAITASSWRVDAFGVNCSLGPEGLMPVVADILKYSAVPVIVQANAGLPSVINGELCYNVDAEEYAFYAAELLDAGVEIIGGCCGTDPSYTEKIARIAEKKERVQRACRQYTAFTGSGRTAILDKNVTVIGERINPTGKKALQSALRAGDYAYAENEAVAQEEAGADMLDVNAGLPDIDEKATLLQLIKAIQGVSRLPLVIDSSDPSALEAAVRHCAGKPVINSVNGSEESLNSIIPIAARYGTGLICLTLDENGIPSTTEDRIKIADRIYARAIAAGVKKEDMLFDCLTLTASASQELLMGTLEALRRIKAKYGVKTVLGVSNVSFGLPSRPKLNSAFLLAALGAGLDAPILNPLSEDYQDTLRVFRVLNGEDKGASRYIAYEQTHLPSVKPTEIVPKASEPVPTGDKASLISAVIHGQEELSAILTAELLKTMSPLDIINGAFIPALDTVGDGFEKGKLFIPQLMASAEAVKSGFNIVKKASGEVTVSRGTVLLATVKGDIHDIGKNIVGMLLENYGFEVVDLGRDVEPQLIVKTVIERNIRLVGLSALMTTTVKNMKLTIEELRKAGCDCKVMVGGAVLNPEYAKQVGADYYAKDASESIKIAAELFCKQKG